MKDTFNHRNRIRLFRHFITSTVSWLERPLSTHTIKVFISACSQYKNIPFSLTYPRSLCSDQLFLLQNDVNNKLLQLNCIPNYVSRDNNLFWVVVAV